MKATPFIKLICIIILSASLASCDKEEDDFIKEPTATSTIITGRICTPEGTPFADIPVSVDYEWRDITGSLLKHKAKGTTDKDGKYRIFFEIGEDIGDARGLHYLRVDLSSISPDKHIMPFPDRKLEFFISDWNKEGKTLKLNITIPRKKLTEITIVNDGFNITEGEYAVANTFSYGDNWQSISYEGAKDNSSVTTYEPITIDKSGNHCITVPLAVGVKNSLQIVYRNNEPLMGYTPVSDIKEINVTDTYSDEATIDINNLSQSYRFKIKPTSRPTTLMGEDYTIAAPLDLVSFRITDGYANDKVGLDMPSFIEPYDSIVWSAKELPDTYKVYSKYTDSDGEGKKLTRQFSTYFYHEGQITNYLKGYKNDKVIHVDSTKIMVYNRDFLCFDWTKGNVSLTGGSSCVYNRLDRMYEYAVTHTLQKDNTRWLSISVIPTDNSHPVSAEKAKAGLQHLLSQNGIEKGHLNLSTADEIFTCLPSGAKPVEFYENASTRILLVHMPATEYTDDTYSLHVESK